MLTFKFQTTNTKKDAGKSFRLRNSYEQLFRLMSIFKNVSAGEPVTRK